MGVPRAGKDSNIDVNAYGGFHARGGSSGDGGNGGCKFFKQLFPEAPSPSEPVRHMAYTFARQANPHTLIANDPERHGHVGAHRLVLRYQNMFPSWEHESLNEIEGILKGEFDFLGLYGKGKAVSRFRSAFSQFSKGLEFSDWKKTIHVMPYEKEKVTFVDFGRR